MAKKKNKKSRELDLTSFAFVQGCGECHPGSGPAEYDRDGNRYDHFANDPANHITPGGDNDFDGDYYLAKWVESGVLEADCLMCHLPSYQFKARKEQINALNFRWAATIGAGFANVNGTVAKGQKPLLKYNSKAFLDSGKIAPHMVREIPTANCLNCHGRPDWKKKGAVYQSRTDVHLRAGLRCVDCHVTGRKAADTRINGREMHQVGKGDDPTGLIRDDLDNTMRTCEDCHLKGLLKAPIPTHNGFPPIHFKKIACQTCHIPQRQVKAALLQDSTVFNDSPQVSAEGKRIWTFYGPDMKPWNLYGENSAFTISRQPLFVFEPIRDWYKGKIFPMNRINSIWVGILANDNHTFGQPYIKDLYKMWTAHRQSPTINSPELSVITDDNHDGAAEVNRPEEFQALIKAVSAYLTSQHEPLAERRVVVVSGTRYTDDGSQWQPLPFKPEPWQYTVYSSVFKLSHDISSARAALGAGGCTDCHSHDAVFWNQRVLDQPFVGLHAETTYTSNAALLGLSQTGVFMGGVRHEWLEPVLYYGILLSLAMVLMVLMMDGLIVRQGAWKSLLTKLDLRLMLGVIGIVLLGPGIIIVGGALIPSTGIGALQTLHKVFAPLLVAGLVWGAIREQAAKTTLFWLGSTGVGFMVISGTLLLVSHSLNIRQIIFTFHDMGALLLCALAIWVFLRHFISRHRQGRQ